MAYGRLKTEMNGTGGGRWTTRADAKHASDRLRRRYDGEEVDNGTNEFMRFREERNTEVSPPRKQD